MRKSTGSGRQTALNAAALQQHLIQQFDVQVTSHEGLIHRINTSGGSHRVNESLTKPVGINIKNVSAVVDTRMKKTTSKRDEVIKNDLSTRPTNPHAFDYQQYQKRKEYVLKESQGELLHNGKQRLTLAEKMGLVPLSETAKAAAQIPNEEEWAKAKVHSLRRGDFQQPCPICHEEFGLNATVLLSCSHVFHKACLGAFERFSGRNSCPLCRASRYCKRIVYEGELQFAHKAATKIQATWKGYCCRRRYQRYCETHPPKDPLLLEKWRIKRVANVTSIVLKEAELVEASADALLDELNTVLEQSRATFVDWDRRPLRETEWLEVEKIAKERQLSNVDEDAQCPICLMSWSEGRGRVLLSCSHVFHQVCLNTMEQLYEEHCLNQHSQFTSHKRICPLCRSPYSKRIISNV